MARSWPRRARRSASRSVADGSPRALAAICGGLAASAALLWGASATPDRAELHSAPAAPALTGLALLALGGVAAVVATGGVLRRAVGAALGAVGVGIVPLTAATSWLAVAGGAGLLVVGLFVLVREPRLARLGARYAAPGARAVGADPDRVAWQDLDAGRDPTAELPPPPVDDPDGGARTGRV